MNDLDFLDVYFEACGNYLEMHKIIKNKFNVLMDPALIRSNCAKMNFSEITQLLTNESVAVMIDLMRNSNKQDVKLKAATWIYETFSEKTETAQEINVNFVYQEGNSPIEE